MGIKDVFLIIGLFGGFLLFVGLCFHFIFKLVKTRYGTHEAEVEKNEKDVKLFLVGGFIFIFCSVVVIFMIDRLARRFGDKPFIFLSPIFLFFFLIFVVAGISGRRRRRRFQEIAAHLGLSYSRRGRRQWLWGNVYVMPHCKEKGAYHILEGTFRGHIVRAAEQERMPKGGEQGSANDRVFLIEHRGKFPGLFVMPSGRFLVNRNIRVFETHYPNFIRFQGDQLSDEFSQAFFVFSPDEKFARAVCHRDMVEFLLRRSPFFEIHFLADKIQLSCNNPPNPEEMESTLHRLVDILELIPDELFCGINRRGGNGFLRITVEPSLFPIPQSATSTLPIV